MRKARMEKGKKKLFTARFKHNVIDISKCNMHVLSTISESAGHLDTDNYDADHISWLDEAS